MHNVPFVPNGNSLPLGTDQSGPCRNCGLHGLPSGSPGAPFWKPPVKQQFGSKAKHQTITCQVPAGSVWIHPRPVSSHRRQRFVRGAGSLAGRRAVLWPCPL